ncbi:MAG: hypothetical protein KF881_07545 [Acidobacteria bacterium]|nr:hypothetical protein [Acidobacteriota bacterium]
MVNNRDIYAGYDADGRQTVDPSQSENIDFYYDAAGMMWKTSRFERYETLIARSGDGGEAKRSQRVWDGEEEEWEDWDHVYFISSSVTGGVVSEATKTGKKRYTYFAAGGQTIARQELTDTNTEIVGLQFRDATGLSSRGFSNEELDGLGNNVGILPNLTSSRYENSMTQGETPTFTDTGMGDCSGSGILGPCSVDDIFGGSFFFSHNWDLPFEVKAFRRNSRDNPRLLNLLSRSAGFLPTADSVPLLIGESIELVPWRLLLEHEGRLHTQATPPSQQQTSNQGGDNEPCVFNINLKVPKGWENTDYEKFESSLPGLEPMKVEGALRRFKNALTKIFEDAGVRLVFNDKKAASNTRNGSYNLKLVNDLSFFARAFLTTTGVHALGWNFGGRGEVSVKKVGMADLPYVAGHEAGHHFLKGFDGLDKDGHGAGIMQAFLIGSGFTPEQAAYLQSLCLPLPKVRNRR